MSENISISGKFAEAKVFAGSLEASAKAQLSLLCDQPFAARSSIRIMPDAHAGAGCVVGTTMTVRDAIVPNLVGVDIGCGMEVVRIEKFRPEYQKLDSVIRESVPSGFSLRTKPHRFASEWCMENLRCAGILNEEKALAGIGSLGGGNHFIEVAVDRGSGFHYLVIHSGSRNPGLVVAEHYQKIADENREDGIPRGLAPLYGQDFDDYVNDMRVMQEYADWNRRAMADVILKGMKWKAAERFSTVHNYLDTKSMILRKGAVSARAGEVLLIPMNMRDGSLLCVGLGNPDWNLSAPHGAGRLMSRNEATKKFTLPQFRKDMEGIWTTCIGTDTIDENPRAYKPMQEILDHIGGTVEVKAILEPLYNFKAGWKERKKKKPGQEKTR